MSVVVALATDDNDVIFGYDHQVTDDNLGRCGTQKKAFVLQMSHSCGPVELGFGIVGTPAMLNSVAYNLVIPEYRFEDFSQVCMDAYVYGVLVPAIAENEFARVSTWGLDCANSQMLIALNGAVYSVDGHFNAVRFLDRYDAIGSGAHLSIGALPPLLSYSNMEPEDIVEIAVGVAIEKDVTCGGPIGIEVVSGCAQ